MDKQLLSLLNDEYKAMEDLLKALEEQFEFLTVQDVFKLEAVTEKIDNCSRELARTEGKRRTITGKVSLRSYVEEINDKSINEVYDRIVKILGELNLQKDSNDLLIRQSLGYTNAMLSMINPPKQPVTYNGYGKIGK